MICGKQQYAGAQGNAAESVRCDDSVSGAEGGVDKERAEDPADPYRKQMQVVTRETLMTRLWESDMYVDENTLSVNVNRLRKS